MNSNDNNENNDNYEELETITITLEDNTELECNILGYFNVDTLEYIALLPINQEEVLIYRYKEENEEITLDLIKDDEEFEKVSKEFNTLFLDEEKN